MIVVAAMVAGMLLVPVVAVAADKLVVIVGLTSPARARPGIRWEPARERGEHPERRGVSIPTTGA
jgi:hypothetical protein